MATFLGIHDMGAGKADDNMIQSSWEAYKMACTAQGLSPKHAHYNVQQGKAYCLTEANSVNQVQKAHDDAKVPVNEILEVKDLN